jgi:hypothetical protein
MRVEQEEMWFHAVMELLLEEVIRRVIDIQVNEIDLPGVFFLNSLDHGRHRQAGATPEGEELDQLRLPRGEQYGMRVGGM